MKVVQLLVLAGARLLLQQAPGPPLHLPFAPVSARAQHVADSVYEKVLESFQAEQGIKVLKTEAETIRAKIANVTDANSRLEGQLSNFTNASNASHALVAQRLDPAVEARAEALAATVGEQASPPLEALVSQVVDASVLDMAAAGASARVLAQACDDAVISAVQTSWKVSEELTSAQHAGRIAALVRDEVRKSCIQNSEATAAEAEAEASAEAARAKPQLIHRAVAAAVHEAALTQARVIVVEQIRAALANQTNGTNLTLPAAAPAPANATPNASAPAIEPTAPVPNVTANATEPAMSDAMVGEMMPVVSMPVPSLSPPPEPVAMNVTIGNVTIVTEPVVVDAFPAVDPRVTDMVEAERLNSSVADRVDQLAEDMGSAWTQNIAAAIHEEVGR